MLRALPVVVVVLLILVPRARAEDDEPMLQGKKLSEWVKALQSDDDVRLRRAAVYALQFFGVKQYKRTITPLATALREDKSEEIRKSAALALGTLSVTARKDATPDFRFESVRDALAAALRGDKAGPVRAASAASLGRLAEAQRDPKDMSSNRLDGDVAGAVAPLAAALKDSHAETRAAAADALRRLGPDAAEALSKLQEVVEDRNADRPTRIQSALAIGRIGAPKALPALAALQTVLTDAKAPADLRKAAAEALGMLGKDASAAAASLGEVLISTSDVILKRAVATALDSMGSEGSAALPALEKAVVEKAQDRFVRCQVLHALGQFGKDLGEHQKSAITAILRCMDDSVLEVRLAAIETLGALGADGLGGDKKAVVERLADAERDTAAAVRTAATAALKKIQMP
jgi:HEAT repeat protein